jgi:hypothetical protein
MNAIAYTVYGSDPKYLYGMERNIEICKARYPEWTVVVMLGSGVPLDWTREWHATARSIGTDLEVIPADFVARDLPLGMPPMFARLLVHDFPEVHRVLFRDADSRPTRREAVAVDEWVASQKLCHTMRDHAAHARELNGGMWGCISKEFNMENEIYGFLRDKRWHPEMPDYGLDQEFLCTRVWPHLNHSVLQHDDRLGPFGPTTPFTVPIERGHFVGEVFNVRVNEHWQYEEEPRMSDRASRGY